MIDLKAVEEAGSSPHARGAPSEKRAYITHFGIIPACAGSTLIPRGFIGGNGDHPRMRGEHDKSLVPS